MCLLEFLAFVVHFVFFTRRHFRSGSKDAGLRGESELMTLMREMAVMF